ncbi:MAG: radical SAM protein [Deltaproteobacteria bacterium]|nr:radical SAM protein [Deltaproteobacteria bacterium]
MAAPIVFVTPPVTKPSEPSLSGPAAAGPLRSLGVPARAIDASIGWYEHVSHAERLEQLVAASTGGPERATAFRRHVRSVTARPHPLRRAETYRSRKVYSSAITHLDGVLELVSSPYPGMRVRVADVSVAGQRPESRAALLDFAQRPGPFDEYLVRKLIPEIAASGAGHVAISLTFQNQAVGAFRLAQLLREHLPGAKRVLGGPLIACWKATGIEPRGGAFDLFDDTVAGHDQDLAALAAELGASPARTVASGAAAAGPLSVDLDEPRWDSYLSPLPVIPVALARGCYWRRCTFCPDHLHPQQRACAPEALELWLDAVAARFPAGAMLHMTDSALPPKHLDRLARAVAERALPLRWHGFVRPERVFADEGFAQRLALGGCEMLQIGVESASPRLLELMGKGADVEVMRRMLRALHGVGIRSQVYLLFGLPTETDEDREQTLRFVEEEAEAICDLNHALLNLPRGSPMHQQPARFGISEVIAFHADTDLSLYDDFRCGASHPRVEARRWLDHRFLKSKAVREILGDLRGPFKANHTCFLPRR